MRKPEPLPHPLGARAFTVAAAKQAGLTPRRLRATDLNTSVWGVRGHSEIATLAERCALVQLRLPDRVFFSHSTAALLHDIPLPWRIEADSTIHVSVAAPARPLSAQGIRGHRLALDSAAVGTRGGLRMTSPSRTWTELAEELTLYELVAAGDYLIHWRHPICSVSELRAAVAGRVNRRGRKLLDTALELLNDRAESPPESHLRVLLIETGFPLPSINHVVTDRFGEFVARTDFSFPAEKVVLEYQGDYHRSNKQQWRADMTRRSKLEAIEGWRVMEINADDLKDWRELATRIRALFARAR